MHRRCLFSRLLSAAGPVPLQAPDGRAVSVWWRNRKLGYVPRSENVALATLLDAGEALEARVVALEESRAPWRRVRFEVELG